jgi:hypothetical protein
LLNISANRLKMKTDPNINKLYLFLLFFKNFTQ